MKYSSIKILEGINCTGIKRVISIICKKQYEKELIKKLKDYEIICESLRVEGSFIKIIHKNEVIEGYITYKNLRVSKFIIDNLLSEADISEILLKFKSDENYVCELELVDLCDKYKIPLMNIDKNQFQIGYGVNLKRFNIEEWKYKKDTIIRDIKERNNWSIPIISITGTNGKTTTARLIHNTLLDLGYKCGMASTGGIYIQDKVIKYGDTTGFYSAREVLKNQNVDIAVLETARGGMLKKGLGYEQGRVAIITSISEDHIGMSGVKDIEDLVNVKSLIADGLGENGVLVIKAIDILFKRFKDRKNLIVFNYEKNEVIDSHINNGGKAYYINDEYIIENNNGVEDRLVKINELPFGFYGVSKSNIKNVIAALAAINVVHENKSEVIEALKKRECNINTNLGRQNIIEFNKFKLIIDYGHNSEAFKEVFSIARALKPNKITAVITAAGDRSDKYIKELGEITAGYADKIIIKEQPDLRGRKVGETAKLLEEGVISKGFSKSCIKVCLEEEEAIKTGLNEAVEGEVIVSFSQFLYLTFPAINEFRKRNGLIAIGENLDLSH